ncbi:unnamed protein product [Heterobilharzia americana]|nr:unnamed protein product [Heterobilharzia americana]
MYPTQGIIHTTFHKSLIPYYNRVNNYNKDYLKKQYYHNPFHTLYIYHYPENHYYYLQSNYQIIPGIEKLKFIEVETMKETKEFNGNESPLTSEDPCDQKKTINRLTKNGGSDTIPPEISYNSTSFTADNKPESSWSGNSNEKMNGKIVYGETVTPAVNGNDKPEGSLITTLRT